MKSLIYKELKLAMHPIIYVFIVCFPFMILIPNYPLAVGFIYIVTSYPILFLGANKGQQSNDLIFSALLPVRKKDIVLARIITLAIIQFTVIAIMSALFPFAKAINAKLALGEGEIVNAGLSLDGFVSVIAIALLCLSIADLIYLPTYYKNGRSIVKSTFFTLIVFTSLLMILTVAIPFIPGCEWYSKLLCDSGVGIQFILLGISLVLYFLIHLLVYKISSKRLEKVDL